jgi:hypothetical protein
MVNLARALPVQILFHPTSVLSPYDSISFCADINKSNSVFMQSSLLDQSDILEVPITRHGYT